MKRLIMIVAVIVSISTNVQAGIIASNLDISGLNDLGTTVTDLTTLTGTTPDIYFEGTFGPQVLPVNTPGANGVLTTSASLVNTSSAFESYYINFRPSDGAFENYGPFSASFSGNILGVATSNGFNGASALLNNGTFEVPGVTYSTSVTDGSIEGDDVISFSGNTLNLTTLRIGRGNSDDFRVFVEVPLAAESATLFAVPEPSSCTLLSLCALLVLRRRR